MARRQAHANAALIPLGKNALIYLRAGSQLGLLRSDPRSSWRVTEPRDPSLVRHVTVAMGSPRLGNFTVSITARSSLSGCEHRDITLVPLVTVPNRTLLRAMVTIARSEMRSTARSLPLTSITLPSSQSFSPLRSDPHTRVPMIESPGGSIRRVLDVLLPLDLIQPIACFTRSATPLSDPGSFFETSTHPLDSAIRHTFLPCLMVLIFLPLDGLSTGFSSTWP